jgi:hypothetical protein
MKAAVMVSEAYTAGVATATTTTNPARYAAPVSPPGKRPRIGWQKSGEAEHDSARGGAGHERATGAAGVVGPVTPCGEKPQCCEHREKDAGGDGERRAAIAVGAGDVRTEGYEGQDLQQEQGASPGILAAVQFMVKGAVEPADPDQGEHRGEFAQPRGSEVFGQMAGGPGNQHDHRQVVEQLEWADGPLLWLLSMCSRRLPQQAVQPFPSLAP